MTSRGAELPQAGAEQPRILSAEDCLYGVPLLHPVVECRFDPFVGYTLCWRLQGNPNANWFIKLISRAGRRCRIQLDDFGRRSVELMDGKRTVREIAVMLAQENETEPVKTEAALLVFVTLLMRKNIVQVVKRGEGE